MVSAEDVVRIYQNQTATGIRLWLTGGWGIDALLHEQTRPHKDLDIIMPVDDVVQMRALLTRDEYRLKELWEENTFITDSFGTEIPTAFVLWDPDGREIDAHAMWLDEWGNGIPAWADADWLTFTKEDLAGEGIVAGVAVQCLSPQMQVLCHTGYDLPDGHRRDMERLRERFAAELPRVHRRVGQTDT